MIPDHLRHVGLVESRPGEVFEAVDRLLPVGTEIHGDLHVVVLGEVDPLLVHVVVVRDHALGEVLDRGVLGARLRHPAERHLEIVAADGLANVGAVHDRAGVPAGGYLGRRRWSGSEHHRRQHMGDRRHSPHKSSPFGGRPRPRVSRTARILGIGRPCGCDREHRDGEPCHGAPSRARPPGTSSGIPNTKRAMPELLGRLQSALADRYRLEREIGAGGMATVYLAAGPPARPAGRAQGAPARAGRRDRRRAVPGRDQAHRQPPAPAHPAAVRLGRGRRLPVLRHAVRRGRDAARPAQPREAAPGRRRGPDRHRGGLARSTTPTATA